MGEKDAIQKGLEAAKDVAADAGMADQVEQLANRIGEAGMTESDAQKDGFRSDYDDSSNV